MRNVRIYAIAAGLAVAACGSDGGGPTGGTQVGHVSGTVTHGSTAVAGGTVTAERTGQTSRTATPTASGFTISNLEVGPWSLTYAPPATHVLAQGEAGTRTVTITQNQTATVSAFQVTPAAQSGVVEIRASGSTFINGTVTIAPGTRVRWINDDQTLHTVTPENANQAGVWQRAELTAQGQVFEHTFTVPGQTYRYRCEPHSTNFTSGMVGTITVTS